MTRTPGDRRTQRLVLLLLAATGAAIGLGVVIRASAMAGLLDDLGPATALKPCVAALGAPWLLAAWLLGALGGRVRLGAAAGALALAGGTVAWYLVAVGHDTSAASHRLAGVAGSWILLGLAAGALVGAAGALWRSPPVGRAGGAARTVGAILPGGWPVAARALAARPFAARAVGAARPFAARTVGAILPGGWPVAARALGAAVPAGCLIGEALLLSTEWSGRPAGLVLRAELLAGLAIPVVLLARRPRALLLCLAFTAIVATLAFLGEDAARDFARGFGWGGR